MPLRRGIVPLALLLLSFAFCLPARHELAAELQRAGGLLARGNRAAIVVAIAAFVLVPLSAAVTWCWALAPAGGRLPRVDACCRYGVGSLVNTFAPARAGDAVRLVLFARLLGGIPCRVLAARFGALELARVAVFGALGVAFVEPAAGALLAGAALAWCACRGHVRLGLAVGAAAAVRVGAFAVALAALRAPSAFGDALRIVPALEIAAIVPLTPGNVAFASLASAAALRAGGMPISSGVVVGIALHVLESAGAVCFGAASLATIVARRAVRWRAGAPAWLASTA